MDKNAIKATMTKVVADLVSLVESSDGDWIRPWVRLGLGKQHRYNGELYRGTNQMFLGLIAVSQGLAAPHVWAGYDAWHEAGWSVRPGESSPYRPIYAYDVVGCKEHGKPEADEKCCENQYRFMRVKLVRPVFHRTQVVNIKAVGGCHKAKCELTVGEHAVATMPYIPVAPPASITPPGIVEAWKVGGMEFREVDSDRAFYIPDYINLPPLGAFSDEAGYYSTLFHEAAHWTGHETRLARPMKGGFGSPEYANEELIAEIGSAMTGAVLGFVPEPNPANGEYLKSWLKALQDDPIRLYDAAVEAEKASQLLLSLGEVKAVAA